MSYRAPSPEDYDFADQEWNPISTPHYNRDEGILHVHKSKDADTDSEEESESDISPFDDLWYEHPPLVERA
jgi:hypothetical protein